MLEHGGRLGRAVRDYGIPRAAWLDLSTGIAPWPLALPSLGVEAWCRLPEDDDGLLSAARNYYGCPDVLAVAGSQAAIQVLPQLRARTRVALLGPCYAEHEHAWRSAGHAVEVLDEASAQARLDDFDVLVAVNPNNPTGRLLGRTRLLDWHARLAARGGWLLVDEAFMDVEPTQSLASDTGLPGLIVLRSFGKFFGLAGARLGFVLAEPALLAALAERLGPWTVSGPARELGRVCLSDRGAQQRQRERLLRASERLHALLTREGLESHGCALFRYVVTPAAARWHTALARQGVLLRLFERPSALRFGLPGDELGWQRLTQALARREECA